MCLCAHVRLYFCGSKLIEIEIDIIFVIPHPDVMVNWLKNCSFCIKKRYFCNNLCCLQRTEKGQNSMSEQKIVVRNRHFSLNILKRGFYSIFFPVL